MVLSDFLTETRRRWLKAFKLFKGVKPRKCNRNKISPASHSPDHNTSGISDIDLENFCACKLSPISIAQRNDISFHSYNSYGSSLNSIRSSNLTDSAYDSARSSPVHKPPCYATVTYYNVNDDDSSSIRTEYTVLEYDDDQIEDENTQNYINESLEMVCKM